MDAQFLRHTSMNNVNLHQYLNKLTALKIHSHQYTWYTFQQFGNTGIGSACIRVSASDCPYSLTGQGLWYSFSFGPSREEKALLNAKFWVSKRLRIVIELQRIKQGNKLSHRMVFLWHSGKESMWALSVKKNQGFTYYISFWPIFERKLGVFNT